MLALPGASVSYTHLDVYKRQILIKQPLFSGDTHCPQQFVQYAVGGFQKIELYHRNGHHGRHIGKHQQRSGRKHSAGLPFHYHRRHKSDDHQWNHAEYGIYRCIPQGPQKIRILKKPRIISKSDPFLCVQIIICKTIDNIDSYRNQYKNDKE